MNEGNMFRFDLWLYNEMKKRNWDSLDLEVESGISRASINLYIKGIFSTKTLYHIFIKIARGVICHKNKNLRHFTPAKKACLV